MPRPIPAIVAIATLSIAVADAASAQTLVRASAEVARTASVREGRIEGIVRDQAGDALKDVSIVAMGETVAAVRSDGRGRFSLVLRPGAYVLRVTRDGYISTYREAVVLRSSALLEREITLVRQGVVAAPNGRPDVLLAGVAGAQPAEPDPSARAGTHSHSEAAWRLRHLPRSVLRDGAGAAGLFDDPEAETFQRRGSLFDRAINQSARLATSFFRDTNFNGQVNFLTTSLLDTSSSWLPDTWPRSIAYFSIGAAGSAGDWKMRGAIGAGDRASWALLGEYQSPREADHSVRMGVSYSAQGYMPQRADRWDAATPAARSVAGVYAYEKWSTPSFEIDYGIRFDRYDYIATPELLSPRAGARVAFIGRLFATGAISQRRIAPGADEFLPPPSRGPWVPPERTFSSLLRGEPLEAERVRHVDLGIGREFGAIDRPKHVQVRRVRQSAEDQIATLFGLDAASGIGHYYVATPGDVTLDAWAMQVGGRFTRRIDATVEYSVADGRWDRRPYAWRLRRAAPSVVRRSAERLHDLTTVVDADIPETSTRITFIYRVNSAFSRDDRGRLPVADGRFDLQIRQALPYQPFRDGTLEVLVAARTLFRELTPGGSFYDELLTVAPPLRLMGGVQFRF